MEIIPFILALGIVLAIEDKITEKLTLLLESNDIHKCLGKLSLYIFKKLNGVELSQSAIN